MPASPTRSGTWIRRFQPAPAARARLICFPHAGGSASYYFPFWKAMTPELEVVAVQYPGRQDRRAERCLEDLNEMADLAIEEVRDWAQDMPVVLFGHSMGASLAFEIARRLESGGLAPRALIASGRRAPSRHRDARIRQFDDAGLIAELKRLSGTDSRVMEDEEVLRLILPSLRSDYTAAETYREDPGARIGCPITAVIGSHDPEVTLGEAGAWSDHTTGEFTLRVLPGGHFFLSEHTGALVTMISEAL
jgi:surfactin synthase thioesterase subunit